MDDVMVVGDVLIDIIIVPEKSSMTRVKKDFNPQEPFLCLEYGAKINLSEAYFELGGSAANVAVGLKRLGYSSAIIGAMGKDIFGMKINEVLEHELVDLSYLKFLPTKLKSAFSVVICFEGERTILVHHLPQYKFLHLPSNLKTKWLYLAPLGQGYNEIYQRAITLAAEKNIKIMLNPGITQIKQGLEHLKNIFRVTEVLIVNQHEAEELVHLPGFPVVDDLIKEISQTGPKVVVITGGKKGAWAYQGEKVYFKKTSHFSSLDATGAGDAFSTGFLAAYLRGEDLSTCLDWGTIDAESVILDYGAQKGLLTSEGLAKKIKSYGQTPRYFLKTKFR